ncbi:hypothetical protein A1QO_03955 [Vibrio genomosp. F10 str. ZF-129]|uniref:Uncharacterized protein n=1 Tax=Vibrio genomosp. F10 str. ZF-129 TaxID=1187848 RepID=A0A1E5BIJ1_9VIBR|nr:hypothetical protein [Vibrio genomosp. F10]OEE37265.1 hypothetical protein A1QO_03955 [Vibrio genomosp. F10 str. ZF-129]
MAYCNQLDENKFSSIYTVLQNKARLEHEQAYKSNVRKAKTRMQKSKCAGQYIGAWQRLFNGWLGNTVSNLHVMDCINSNTVIGDTEGVSFISC